MVKKILVSLLLIISYLPVFSVIPQLTENSKVSLLTCSSNTDAIYALFGHTGLRVSDDSLKIDVVFDYGVFDFNSDNFIYRFVKGETDYRIGDRSYDRFLFEYAYRGSGVREQIINLSLKERQAVFEALLTNLRPENRVYRYNFFYDNCATRPRDIIKNNLDGELIFKPYTGEQTYRDLLEECLILSPWSRFGINLVIGSGADKVISERQKDFLPLYVSQALDNAIVQSSQGEERALVFSNQEVLEAGDTVLEFLRAKESGLTAVNTPLYVGVIVLLLAISVSYLLYYKQKQIIGKVFDILLFTVAGLAGCIIFFLMFFSEHPCVDANWNLAWLNPLALLVILFLSVKIVTKYVIYYHFVNFATLTLFLLCVPFIPQTIEIAFIPYILALWIRSGVNILEYKQIKRK